MRPGDRPAPYAGKRAALATMHQKQVAIEGPLRSRLGLELEVPIGLDTDRLGTFTGEIPRAGSIEQAAVAKARLGMAASGARIGVASEGSYGPHPEIPFAAAGLELMVLVDDEEGIVIREQLVDDRPRFVHATTETPDGLGDFLARAGFPAHALIVRPNRPEGPAAIAKGLRLMDDLAAAIVMAAAGSTDGHAFVQSDMRAHMNPTRMATLGRLAQHFAARIETLCPACGAPGFGLVEAEKGLPCSWCGGPSVLVRHQLLGCVACRHVVRRPRVDGLTMADPAHCPYCNP